MDPTELKHQTNKAAHNGDGEAALRIAGDPVSRCFPPPANPPSVSNSAPGNHDPAGSAATGNSGVTRTYLVWGVAALIVLAGLAVGFLPRWRQRQQANVDMNQLAIPTVSVVSPVPEKTGGGLALPAEIKPWLEASIYARANGYLENWVADIGAHVEAGQLLALIETPDLDQQLAQARAELVLAQANQHLAEVTDNRWRDLLKTASVSEQEAAEKAAAHETASASVAASEANVRRLEELVSFQRVTAPFAGVITIRAVDVGDLIVASSGGSELFHLAQTDKLRVYVRVPEPGALGIAPGQQAVLTTPENPGREFVATVTTTSEAISAVSRTLLTELEVNNTNHQILPYSYGEVRFKGNSSGAAMTLPSDALLFRAQGLQVAVVRPDDTLDLRKVQVGRDFGQTIEILDGVTLADHVVANPSDSLLAGIKVRELKAKTSPNGK
jgi:RND family efflux transporter MFP subunit